ncbi:MAG: C39 family peptidase [Gemmatimonadetes bacterium]|nr:C39 family peptidase [Gemmatimonadota bacterium]
MPTARVSYELPVQRFLQPDDVTCGPTCLRKVYHFYGLNVPLEELTAEVDRHEDGGTLAVSLGIAALRRGFCARIYSYNLRIFDPTWASLSPDELRDKLGLRLEHLRAPKSVRAGKAYLEFLSHGGEIAFDELTPKLLKAILNRNHPILAGLSATYLYRMPRERHDPETHELLDDDVAGDPTGHFVVISGYDQRGRRFTVRDPSAHAPTDRQGRVAVEAHRLTNAIMLGDLTYDAVLLELWLPEREGVAP